MKSTKKLYFTYRGRVSLYILLKAMNVQKNDLVAVQSFTCSAVIESILALKAKPIFIDINSKDLMINKKDLVKKISDKKKIKAIIIQYTFGLYSNINSIKKICNKKKIFLIEDCCHINPNKTFKNGPGSFGDASFFSFEWGKPIIGGIGGAFIVNNKSILKKTEFLFSKLKKPSIVKEIIISLQYIIFKIFYNPKTYWVLKDLFNYLSKKKIIIGNFSSKDIRIQSPDFNFKSLRFSEKIVESQLKKNENRITITNKIINRINKFYDMYKMNNFFNIKTKKKLELLRIPIFLNHKQKILKLAKQNKIEIASWYISPVHPYMKHELKRVGYKKNSCPNAEKISNHLVSLPLNISSRKLEQFFKLINIYDQ